MATVRNRYGSMSGTMISEVQHGLPGGMIGSTLAGEWVVTKVVLKLVAGSPVEPCIYVCTLVASETGFATMTRPKNTLQRDLPGVHNLGVDPMMVLATESPTQGSRT